MKQFISTLIVFFLAISAEAQLHFGDSLRVSLLTVAPGEQAFERFGHTGLRVTDLKTNHDVVFHYGVYDYTEPNFIWHFVEGKCNYRMGANYMRDFLTEHRRRRLDVTEQVLQLDSAQAKTLVNALVENYLPQNRNYRYNFFFDNCATRPFMMLNRCATIEYDTTWVRDMTLRDMLHEKTGIGQWLDFGIALTVAGRADQRASFAEQMFLPDYLSQAIGHAKTNGHAMVSETLSYPFGDGAAFDTGAWFLRPMPIGCIVFAIGLLLTILANVHRREEQRHWPRIWSRIFDTVWLLATGLAGCIVWLLNFLSEHPAVDHNLNCLWLLPTNLLFIAFIWTKRGEKVRRIYFFIIFAAVILYIMSVCVSAQYCHAAFVPLIATVLMRCADHIWNRK